MKTGEYLRKLGVGRKMKVGAGGQLTSIRLPGEPGHATWMLTFHASPSNRFGRLSGRSRTDIGGEQPPFCSPIHARRQPVIEDDRLT